MAVSATSRLPPGLTVTFILTMGTWRWWSAVESMPTGWGFALQLGTVRFLGTFLADPTGVPMAAIAYDHEVAVAGRTSLPRSVQRLELNGETRREASWPPTTPGQQL
jgi:hypothetical protein